MSELAHLVGRMLDTPVTTNLGMLRLVSKYDRCNISARYVNGASCFVPLDFCPQLVTSKYQSSLKIWSVILVNVGTFVPIPIPSRTISPVHTNSIL